jgi:omega-6 fatty acid desaturase (delta-12 desaturase)
MSATVSPERRAPRRAAPPEQSVKAVRDTLPADARERSAAVGVACFAVSLLGWGAVTAALALAPSWWARVPLAVAGGLAAGVLFIVGHDACHGSLTPSAGLNGLLGRVAFLPSLHPFVAWAHSHNALHHGWTNLRGKDPVYAPLTLGEYRALGPWRRLLERAYRTWLGVGLLYLLEIWWPLEIVPNAEHRAPMDRRGSFARDRALVLAFVPLEALGLYALSGSWAVAALGVVLPFLTFAWLMGFATFQHHTHPRVVWYDDEREWSYYRSQVQGTVHVEFPRWVDALLHHIMDHTAHHVDTRVPLYRLKDAQRAVEEAFGEENVISVPFSLGGTRRTFRACQLYDYRAHRWLSFDGTPTTAPRRLDEEARASA